MSLTLREKMSDLRSFIESDELLINPDKFRNSVREIIEILIKSETDEILERDKYIVSDLYVILQAADEFILSNENFSVIMEFFSESKNANNIVGQLNMFRFMYLRNLSIDRFSTPITLEYPDGERIKLIGGVCGS